MIITLKTVAYYLFSSKIFNLLLKPVAYIFLKIRPIEHTNYQTPQVILTIDCESGFLNSKKQRVWMFQEPQAFQGYYFGIKNILNLLKKYNVKATFFLSTQCFSSEGKTKKLIISTLIRIINEGHELGLHLHPKEDLSLKKECKINFKFTSAKYYDKKTIELMIIKSKLLVSRYLGSKITDSIISFRWANFALDLNKTKSIEKYFKIDSSICPGCFGHNNDDRKYDWANYRKNYIHKLNNIIEAPITTFWFLGWNRADPSLGSLTEIAFNKYLKYKVNPFILLTHSTECTYKNGNATYVINNLEGFIKNCINKKIEFITLKHLLNG